MKRTVGATAAKRRRHVASETTPQTPSLSAYGRKKSLIEEKLAIERNVRASLPRFETISEETVPRPPASSSKRRIQA
jgi:hypothetical protein